MITFKRDGKRVMITVETGLDPENDDVMVFRWGDNDELATETLVRFLQNKFRRFLNERSSLSYDAGRKAGYRTGLKAGRERRNS